jgi:hypothetical protein
LAPVWLPGASTMLDYTLLNKGPYLQSGGASYWAEVLGLITPDSLGVRATLQQLYRGVPLLLLPVAAAGVLDVWRRGSRETRLKATAVLLLVASGVIGAYPRLNRFHLSYAVPGVVVLAFSAEIHGLTRLSPTAMRGLAGHLAAAASERRHLTSDVLSAPIWPTAALRAC